MIKSNYIGQQGNRSFNCQAEALGHWDSRIAEADSDPEMISNPNYWEGYCEGMYQRYLEKYGINRSN